jgi:hypothetical protein
MLALVGQKGDWCTRTDLGTNWVITGNDPTQLASWTALTYPASPVVSVNGETGAVSLDATDVGAAPVSHGTHLTDGDKGDIIVGGSGTTLTIDNNAVTNGKLATVSEQTIKGRAVGTGTGNPTDLTGTQVAAILPTAAANVRGVVVPPNNTTLFLRGDGTWVAPTASASKVIHEILHPHEPVKSATNMIGISTYTGGSWDVGAGGDFIALKSDGGSFYQSDYGYQPLIGPKESTLTQGTTLLNFSTYAFSAGVFTLTASHNHYTNIGDMIVIRNVHPNVDGTRRVFSVNGRDVIVYPATSPGGNISPTATTGTGEILWPNLNKQKQNRLLISMPPVMRPELPAGWSWRPDYTSKQSIVCLPRSGTGQVVWETPVIITNFSRTSNVATATTATAHGYSQYDRIRVFDQANMTFSSTDVIITSVPTTTSFTYENVGTNVSTFAAGAEAFSACRIVPGVREAALNYNKNLRFSGGFYSAGGALNSQGLGIRSGSFSSVTMSFFTCTARIGVLPEAGREIVIGQLAVDTYYGYGAAVDSAGTLSLKWYEGGTNGTALVSSAAVVAAGDKIHIAKFGNLWTIAITAGTSGLPKANSQFQYWMAISETNLGYADIFGTMAVGFWTDSNTGRINDIRFYG